jgi:hypothetical protein|tara:strand:- start:2402 stop:3283 length:882 start_codon:yes stop_codon:yes gene_type:complete
LIYLLYIILITPLIGQDDLLDILEDDSSKPVIVESSFKGTRVVNAQSLELPRPKILQFMIQHRFGSIENGFYDLFGMDYATIRFDFNYGLTERLSFGVGRSSLDKIYDIFVKTKLLRQSSGTRSFPVSVLLYSDIGIDTKRKSENDPAVKDEYLNRLLYVNQLIIGRKFNRSLSLEILPTLIHRNLVPTNQDDHDLVSVGIAGRYKLSNRISVNADYFIPLGDRSEDYQNSVAIGVDYETGGHVFQVMIANSQGPYEYTFIENARGNFSTGVLYLGFNISRAFTLAGDNEKLW